ncbi:hypothetical protein HDZ31DRAFT_60803 [Schizophyllum fasciatum]
MPQPTAHDKAAARARFEATQRRVSHWVAGVRAARAMDAARAAGPSRVPKISRTRARYDPRAGCRRNEMSTPGEREHPLPDVCGGLSLCERPSSPCENPSSPWERSSSPQERAESLCQRRRAPQPLPILVPPPPPPFFASSTSFASKSSAGSMSTGRSADEDEALRTPGDTSMIPEGDAPENTLRTPSPIPTAPEPSPMRLSPSPIPDPLFMATPKRSPPMRPSPLAQLPPPHCALPSIRKSRRSPLVAVSSPATAFRF